MSERETNRLNVGDYPIGTKVHSWTGRFWERVEQGWQANGGSIFPTYGGDASWVELPAPSSEGSENSVGIGASLSVDFSEWPTDALVSQCLLAAANPPSPEVASFFEVLAKRLRALSQPEQHGGGAVGGEAAAWLHPTANWAHVDKVTVERHCPKHGPAPVPLYRATLTPVSDPKDLEAELRKAREANRKLHRRAQRAEGVVAVLEDSLELWARKDYGGSKRPWKVGFRVASRAIRHYVQARLERNAGRTLLARLDKKGGEE